MTDYAAVDCGTNSTRLLIADESGKRVIEELRITRLGEGVHKNASLLPEATRRTCVALREFKELVDTHGVAGIRAVATSAVRDSANAADFIAQASAAIGCDIEVISGTEEAVLTFAGATSTPLLTDPQLVIDIGGGSTEFVLGERSKVAFAESFQLGCVRLTERYLHSDPPTVAEFEEVTRLVEATIARSQLPDLVATQQPNLIAVAGTATSLAALDLGLDEFESDEVDGHILSFESIAALHAELASKTVAERTNRVIPTGRAEVILGGSIVLISAMRALGFSNCRVSVSDLLTGLVFDQASIQDDR